MKMLIPSFSMPLSCLPWTRRMPVYIFFEGISVKMTYAFMRLHFMRVVWLVSMLMDQLLYYGTQRYRKSLYAGLRWTHAGIARSVPIKWRSVLAAGLSIAQMLVRWLIGAVTRSIARLSQRLSRYHLTMVSGARGLVWSWQISGARITATELMP